MNTAYHTEEELLAYLQKPRRIVEIARRFDLTSNAARLHVKWAMKAGAVRRRWIGHKLYHATTEAALLEADARHTEEVARKARAMRPAPRFGGCKLGAAILRERPHLRQA